MNEKEPFDMLTTPTSAVDVPFRKTALRGRDSGKPKCRNQHHDGSS
jgi:hypothetical protein